MCFLRLSFLLQLVVWCPGLHQGVQVVQQGFRIAEPAPLAVREAVHPRHSLPAPHRPAPPDLQKVTLVLRHTNSPLLGPCDRRRHVVRSVCAAELTSTAVMLETAVGRADTTFWVVFMVLIT